MDLGQLDRLAADLPRFSTKQANVFGAGELGCRSRLRSIVMKIIRYRFTKAQRVYGLIIANIGFLWMDYNECMGMSGINAGVNAAMNRLNPGKLIFDTVKCNAKAQAQAIASAIYFYNSNLQSRVAPCYGTWSAAHNR